MAKQPKNQPPPPGEPDESRQHENIQVADEVCRHRFLLRRAQVTPRAAREARRIPASAG